MELTTKLLDWSSGVPSAVINCKTARKMGMCTRERISIRTIGKNSKSIDIIVDTVGKVVKSNEILLSCEAQKMLGVKAKQKVEISLAKPPKSLYFIKKKLNDGPLSKEEITEIVADIVKNSLSEAEIALFVAAMYDRGMTFKETVFLIEAILNSGNRLSLKNKIVADKHSIGGIPGNRTTPLVVSICAAAGLIMPKTSSRAITSAAGTADVIESIARVDFSVQEIKKIIKKTNACMVWGGALEMAPADDRIIQVEKLLKIDPEAQLLASIMAKKIAVGSKYILLDIPYGETAKVNKKKAKNLKKKFIKIGKYFKENLRVVLTDGSQPIGNGIGPILELIDIIKILDPKQDGPKDLTQKSLFLAGELFEMTGKAKKGQGIVLAKKILSEGKAFEKFKQIIEAQEGSIKNLAPAKFTHSITAKKSGKIYKIDNQKINSLARAAGCPADKASGLYLHLHIGEKVNKNEKVLTIYASSKTRLNQAIKTYKDLEPITIK